MKKLFALVCVIALLGALCVPAMAAAARIPVAAEVPGDWTTAYLYAWGSSSETMTWPGVPMTKIDDWFVAYMNDDHANVIINNGSGAQTADLTVDPGMPVCVMAGDPLNAKVEVDLPIEVPAESEMPKPKADTVYALVPEAWATAYVYAWGDSGAMTWPGTEMTQGDDGLWVGELTPGYKNVIIAEKDGGAQTIDLPYNGGDCWVLLTAEADASGKFAASVLYEKPEKIEHPTDPVVSNGPVPTSDVWYVAGTMNGWNNCDSAYEMLPNGDGSFSFTLSLTAGDHALKVTNGTWDVCFGKEGGTDGNYEFGMSADGEATVNYDGNGVVTVVGDNVTDPTGTGTGNSGAATGDNWYVAGTMNEWNCADEAYKMTKGADGIFRYTFDAIPGDYSLKVTNGTWDVSFGGDGENGNYDFNAADEGKVTVKFDGSAVSIVFGEEEGVVDTDKDEFNADVPGGDKDDDTDKGGNNGLVISIVATVVILVGGAAAVFFVLKKKN